MPQPNEFPKNFYVPESMSDLVIPSAARSGQHHTDVDFPIYRFLKKVKGCQSLGLALSWVSVNLYFIWFSFKAVDNIFTAQSIHNG